GRSREAARWTQSEPSLRSDNFRTGERKSTRRQQRRLIGRRYTHILDTKPGKFKLRARLPFAARKHRVHRVRIHSSERHRPGCDAFPNADLGSTGFRFRSRLDYSSHPGQPLGDSVRHWRTGLARAALKYDQALPKNLSGLSDVDCTNPTLMHF